MGKARRLLEEGLALYRQQEDWWGIATALYYCGDLEYREGRLIAARDCFDESKAIAREHGHQDGIANFLDAMAALAALSQPEQAVRLSGAAQAWRQVLGPSAARAARPDPPGPVADLAALRTTLGEAAFLTAWRAGAADEGLPPAMPPPHG